MTDLNHLLELVLIGDYPGMTAGLIFLALALLKKLRPGTWERLPKRWRFLVPLGMAAFEAAAESLSAGYSWQQTGVKFAMALVEGLLAMGLHGALTNSPLPYNDKP